MNDGATAEARFAQEALARGFVVSIPTFRSAAYDAVITRGDRDPIRVQVKSCTRKKVQRKHHTPYYSVEVRRGPEITNSRLGSKRPYRPGSYDVMAIWLDEDRRWLFVPRRRVPKAKLRIIPHKGVAKHLDNWDRLMR